MGKKRRAARPEPPRREPTPQDEAFLRAILADPEDDTPRLVYADYLEEHGDPDRAEFIRVQCAMAKLDEDDERRFDLEAAATGETALPFRWRD